MEFYELFEHVPEDFNIFSGDGIWMSNGTQEQLVEQRDLKKYLEVGWEVGKISNG